MKRAGRTVLLSLLAIAVLAAMLWFGDARKVLATVVRFKHLYLLWFALLLIGYELVRGLLWLILLRALALRAPPRAEVFAFAVGESAKFVPTGAYLQNILLQRSAGAEFARSAAATTLMIVGEIVVALLGVLALGLGDWSSWLRIAVAAGSVILLAFAVAYLTAPRTGRRHRWITRYALVNRVLDEFRRFREGAAALIQPRILIITLLLTVLYVLLGSADLYVVVRALDIGGVTFWQAVAVNCFGLAFYVVLGSLEAADAGALIGIGVSRSEAVSAILVTRVLTVGMTIVLTALVLAVLRDQWPALSRTRHGRDS